MRHKCFSKFITIGIAISFAISFCISGCSDSDKKETESSGIVAFSNNSDDDSTAVSGLSRYLTDSRNTSPRDESASVIPTQFSEVETTVTEEPVPEDDNEEHTADYDETESVDYDEASSDSYVEPESDGYTEAEAVHDEAAYDEPTYDEEDVAIADDSEEDEIADYDGEYYEDYYEDTETTMVWVSRTGSKYHSNPDCSNMKDPGYISLEEAIAEGREACKKCW